MASVEVHGRMDGFGDADRGWESSVEGPEETGGRDIGSKGKAGHLAERMDAGIGAAGALGQDGFTGDVQEGAGERALNGRETGLHLPPVKGSAVIGEGELPIAPWVLPEYRAFNGRETEGSGLL